MAQTEWNPTAEELGATFTPTDDQTNANIVTIPPDFDPEFLASLVPDGETPAADTSEADAQATAAAAAQAEADAQAAKGWIPKGRFNEVLDKNKAIEAQVAALQQQIEAFKKPAEQQPDPALAMEERVDSLLIASQIALTDYGIESEEYKASVRIYNRANRELMALEADRAAGGIRQEQAAVIQTKAALDEVAEKNYETYPFLDKNSDAPDVNAINQVIEMRNAYIETGTPPADALQRAIDLIAPIYAAKIQPVVPDATKAAEVLAARERAAREKAAATTKQQPAFVVGRTDEGGFKLDIDKMTPEEVAKLPKEVLDKLAGNVVTDEEIAAQQRGRR